MKEFVAALIPYLVVLAQALLLVVLILQNQKPVRRWLTKNSVGIIFVVSLLAMLGSLFYSLIMGYAPCDLCWYQRILMYPLVLISGFSLREPAKQIKKIVLAFAGLGSIFAAYHYATQLIASSSSFCAVGATDCTAKVVFSFGYISIPLMALTAFAIIIFVTFVSTKKK